MDVLRSVSRRVRSADAFPKTLDDFRVKTASGGFVSVAALLIIAVLVLSETSTFLTAERSVNISVDDVRNETLQIFIDVVFPRLNCDVIGVDALDGTLVPYAQRLFVPRAISYDAMGQRRTAGCALVVCSREAGKVSTQDRGGSDSEGEVLVLLVLPWLLERWRLTDLSFGHCVLFCRPLCLFPWPVVVACLGLWQSLATCSWKLQTTCTRLDWTWLGNSSTGTRRSAWGATRRSKRYQLSSRLSSRPVTAAAVMVQHPTYVRLDLRRGGTLLVAPELFLHGLVVITACAG